MFRKRAKAVVSSSGLPKSWGCEREAGERASAFERINRPRRLTHPSAETMHFPADMRPRGMNSVSSAARRDLAWTI